MLLCIAIICYSCEIEMKHELCRYVYIFFCKILKCYSSWKICIVGAETFHVDGEAEENTDMMKQIVAFCG